MNYEAKGDVLNPAIILVHALGGDHSLWKYVVPFLEQDFYTIAVDLRGHGKSPIISRNGVTIADFGEDVLALMEALNIKKAAFCGISIGGLVGQYLGLHHPSRFSKLVLSNTAAKVGSQEGWNDRIRQIQDSGLESLAEVMPSRWFSDKFIEENPIIKDEIIQLLASNHVPSYCASCLAIGNTDFKNEVSKIVLPTLIIAGSNDLSTTLSDSEFLYNHIPNSHIEVLNAKHMPPVEFPEEFSKLVIDFLKRRD